MANTGRVALRGSERAPLHGARSIGPTDPHQLIEVSVLLKHRQSLNNAKASGRFMSHNEFASQCGADPAHVDRLRQFARDNKLQILERGDEILRRTVTLAGTAAQMEKAFGVELNEFEHPDGSYRGRTGSIQIPQECADIIQGVFGLDDRPVAKPHFRYKNNHNHTFGARTSNNSFSANEIAKLYNYPQDVNGTGQVIGLLELGGGYRPADAQQYFQSLGLQTPAIKTASVDQAKNRPSTPDSADGEVMLDIEIAGAVAPGAMIVVYFAPNTDRGFIDALSMAVHDQLRGPRVLSISWGGPENSWTQQAMESFDQIAQEASLLGITICAAAGDNGSSDGINDGQNHVDFPASCPHVLACGGTRLTVANGAVTNETVWNDLPNGGATGGGYSTFFDRPAYQTNTQQSKRGVPDVCGNADPETGYNVLVDGQQMVVGGTSAVAPLWAGLIALMCQKTQTRMGFLNSTLYECAGSNCFRQITQGNNGAFSAGQGWSPVAGLGSPLGAQLLQAQQATAGKSQGSAAQGQGSSAQNQLTAATQKQPTGNR